MRQIPFPFSQVILWMFTGIAGSHAQALENVIPANQPSLLRTFPPSAAEQTAPGVGKFVIFTREKVGEQWDFIAGAWECVPSRPDQPVLKRAEFCHSSWNASPLLGCLVSDESEDVEPRFVRLQVDAKGNDYRVNLYDVDYRTWDVRCIWQGQRLSAFGMLGRTIFCRSDNGWFLLDAGLGSMDREVPFEPFEVQEPFWMVRKPREPGYCWSFDCRSRALVMCFRDWEKPARGFRRTRLSPDGRLRAVVEASVADWKDGMVLARLTLQGNGKDIAVRLKIPAVLGSGFPLIPLGTGLAFADDGNLEYRGAHEEQTDQVWTLDVSSGTLRSELQPSRRQASSPVFDGVPVPEYLEDLVKDFSHFGRGGLAPAFFLYKGVLKEPPEYSDCNVAVSPDGRHVLLAMCRGELAGRYFYGNLRTGEVVSWPAPEGLSTAAAQEFVWVETPDK